MKLERARELKAAIEKDLTKRGLIVDPKPPVRAPKAPKPLPRRRARKRTYKTPRCIGVKGKGYCKKPQEHLQRCTPHAKDYLDALVRQATAGDRCELDHDALGINCVGDLQVLHGLDRDELGVRWDLRNVFRGCSGANAWGHVHKRRWYLYVRAARGADVYDDLCSIADSCADGFVKIDYEQTERGLLAALEVKGMTEPQWPTCKICGWKTPNREQPFAQAQAANHLEEFHGEGSNGR